MRIRPSSKSVINGKRPKNRFLWSSGKFKPQPVFSSFQPQILYSRNTGEKKDKKKENRKLKLAIEARKFQFKNSNSNVTLNDKTLKGCGCEWQNGSTFDVEALYVSVDGTNSFTISPIAFASAVARESVDNFNETDEVCVWCLLSSSLIDRILVIFLFLWLNWLFMGFLISEVFIPVQKLSAVKIF